jgi:hypothetical protein
MVGRFWAGALLALAVGAQAAPSVTVKVGGNGRLDLPPQVIRKLGVKQKRGELVCVQFPRPKPAPVKTGKTSHGFEANPPDPRAPRIYTGLRNDGGLTVTPTRALTLTGMIPGKPGTVYRAVSRS